MFTQQHIDFLREKLAEADEVSAGWRHLLRYAEANTAAATALMVPCQCGLPGTPGMVHLRNGQCYTADGSLRVPPYVAGDTKSFPLGENPRTAWTPAQERHFQGFEAAHKELAAETPGEQS